jgi:hypothetical protein
LLKGADKNPVDPPRQQLGKVVLSKVQRKLPQIVAVEREHVESVKLHLGVVPARTVPECRPVYPIALELRACLHQRRLSASTLSETCQIRRDRPEGDIGGQGQRPLRMRHIGCASITAPRPAGTMCVSLNP